MSILIDFAAGNHTVLEVVFNRGTAIDSDLNHLSFLRAVGELEFIMGVIQDVVLVRTALLQVIAAEDTKGMGNGLQLSFPCPYRSWKS